MTGVVCRESGGDLNIDEVPVLERLQALQITFERYAHPPIATADEGEIHWAGIDAVHCKNLFLRNQKGSQHYLVILAHTKRADLRRVADQIGDGKLSFASPERLMTYLKVTPGSVSPFGLYSLPTSSTDARSAASPRRWPSLSSRVYPPFRPV